eukprot:gene14941-biopygen6235
MLRRTPPKAGVKMVPRAPRAPSSFLHGAASACRIACVSWAGRLGAPRGSRLDPGGSRRRPLGSLGGLRGPRGGPKGAQGAVELFTRRCVSLPYCLCFVGWAARGATGIAARSPRIPKASAGMPWRPSWAAGSSQGRPGRRLAFYTAPGLPAALLVFRGLGGLGRHGDRGSIPEDPEGVRWDPWAAFVGRGVVPRAPRAPSSFLHGAASSCRIACVSWAGRPGAPRGSRLDPGGSRRRPLGSLGGLGGPRGGPKGLKA